MDEEKYTLVGVDSNALSIVAYTKRAMIKEHFTEKERKEMIDKALKGDYNNVINTCMDYIELCNKRAKEKENVNGGQER